MLIIWDLPQNVGLGEVRDLGIKYATGKYIMFVDSDDWIESDTVSECVKAIERFNADLVEFGFSRRLSYRYDYSKSPVQYQIYETAEIIEEMTDHMACNKLFVLDKIRDNKIKFRYRVFEDTLFTRKYSMCCKKAVFISNKWYNYYVNPNSLTSTCSIDQLKQNDRTEEVIEFYEVHNLIKQRDKFIKNSLMFLVRHLIPLSKSPSGHFQFSLPSGLFAQKSKPYIDKFNYSGILFRLSAYKLLGIRSAAKIILKHGL